MKGRPTPGSNIDLGLAISALSLEFGQTRTTEEIAAFCGCTKQNISHIELRALRKLRVKLQFHKDPTLRELVATLTKR